MSKHISRRTLLRGLGTVAIGLPFLAEMKLSRGDTPQGINDGVPERLITVFFGLGLDPSWQQDFNGPLQPFQALAEHMAFCSTSMHQGNQGGAHCETSTVVFVGEQQSSVNIAGGPSLDQMLRAQIDPSAPTLASGLWWRRGACDAQALRVYNPDGTGRPPIKRPSEVFDQVFGSIVPPDDGGDSEAQRRELRIRRSILDTVMDQYQSLRSDRSYLGAESKLKIEQHLNSIREIEQQLAPSDDIIDSGTTCEAGDRPDDPPIADYDRFTYGTGNNAPAIHWEDTQAVFALHAQLYALALRCDLVRYGNLMFESAGGHTNVEGTYSALGTSTDFPGDSQHDSYFHGNQVDNARLYQHFALSNIATFLNHLADPTYIEANGKTVLENATIVIGTEYGWNHSKENVFHAVVGGKGRYRSGFFVDQTINCIDLYNAIMQGHGITANIGQATGVNSQGDASFLLA
ncbi:MAG: DUF1552 domain-containing protein [Myxococcota bacterium]